MGNAFCGAATALSLVVLLTWLFSPSSQEIADKAQQACHGGVASINQNNLLDLVSDSKITVVCKDGSVQMVEV